MPKLGRFSVWYSLKNNCQISKSTVFYLKQKNACTGHFRTLTGRFLNYTSNNLSDCVNVKIK